VSQFYSTLSEYPTDEQASMAVVRVALAANKRETVGACSVDHPFDRRAERRFLRHGAVQRVALVVVVGLAGRTPTEFLAEEQVAHPVLSDGGLKLLAIEMRGEPRVREGADVDQELDLLLRDEAYEGVELVVRVPYGPNGESRGHQLGR
jgi:hypothetical protein